MTDWVHRTMIVPAALAPLARALAAAAAPGESGTGMWVTELSPDSGRPPTHYISAGSIWGAFADLLPLHDSEIWDATPEADRTSPRPVDSTGHPEQVVALASEAGQPVPLATVQALLPLAGSTHVAGSVLSGIWACASSKVARCEVVGLGTHAGNRRHHHQRPGHGRPAAQ